MEEKREFSIGIDISDHTIEIVRLSKEGSKIKVKNLARTKIASGAVIRGRIRNQSLLKKSFQKLLREAGLDNGACQEAIFGLPESQVYVHTFKKNSGEGELRSMLLEEIRSFIPIKTKELLYSYRVIESNLNKDQKNILVVASSIEVIKEWNDFFRSQKIKIKYFDIEPLALFRAMYDRLPEKPLGILDIGSTTTNLSIFSSIGLTYTYEMHYAGNYFDKKLADILRIDMNEAEKLKIEKGVNISPKAKAVLRTAYVHIGEELKRNFEYFENNYHQEVNELVLAGGSSQTKGLPELFNDLDIDFKISRGQARDPKFEDIKYMEAYGLALRGLEKRWEGTDPYFSLEKRQKMRAKKEKKVRPSKNNPNNFLVVNFFIFFIALLGLSFAYVYFSKPESSPDPSPPADKTSADIPVVMPEASGETAEGKAAPVFMIVKEIGNTLNVRSGPSTAYEVITRIGPGESFELINEDGSWKQIQLKSGDEGWVHGDYVELIK